MKFCEEKIQKHLLNGGKIKRVFNNKDGNYCIISLSNDNALVFAGTEEYYTLTRQDLTSNNWEIVEPEYDWDKIIKDKILCVFSDDEDRGTYVISPLIKVEGKGFSFMTIEELSYSHCKPFNPADFNIAKDLKEFRDE